MLTGNAYFFGTNGGSDTINFSSTVSTGTTISGTALTIAYSADLGATSTAITVDSTTYASTSQTKIAIGSDKAVWVVGYSSGSISNGVGPIALVTVANSTITALG